MSNLTILGDTSGSVVLQAPAVSGSTTLTLPATTGTVLASGSTGVCRAWVNFSVVTGSAVITSSYNVSSVVRNSTLNYTVNFTVPFSNANYAFTFGGSNVNNSSGTNFTGFYAYSGSVTASSFTFAGLNIFAAGANQSSDATQAYICVAFFA